MPNSPENYNFITWVWVVGLSILGGMARTVINITKDMSMMNIFRMFMVDIIVSIFIGFVTFFLCQAAGLDMLWTIAFVSLTAHMGTRVLVIYEERVYAYFKNKENDKL